MKGRFDLKAGNPIRGQNAEQSAAVIVSISDVVGKGWATGASVPRCGVRLARQRQVARSVQEAVQGLRPLGQFDDIALENLGEGVEKAPGVALNEFRVVRVA
jgi:hypothetical protein